MVAMVEFDEEWANATDYARMYRALGLQVVPAHAPSEGGQWKRPFGEWLEFQDTLAPQAVFDRWYDPHTGEHRARKQMGIVTGLASGGVFVVDLDDKPGSIAAFWWDGLCSVHNNGMGVETWAQRTGGGGRQLFFKAPPGWTAPTFKTPVGIDIRGQGGFAMAPPSMHSSGRPYDWEAHGQPWNVDLAVAPDWLIEAIETLREEHGGVATGPREHVPSDGAKNAFGLDVDDREHKLQVAVWGAVVDLYREAPIPPSPEAQEAEIARLWANYERTTKSRLTATDGQSNSDLLEREGRGLSELRRKWAYAMKRWDTKVREAAGVARPNPPPGANGPSETPAPDGSITEASPGDLVVVDVFTGDPPERQWLVPEWIAEGVVNSMYGGPGTGKSLLAMQLGAAVSLGDRWLGLTTKPGVVLGIFCEDDHDELHRRWWDVRRGMGYVIGPWPFPDLKTVVRVGHENRLAIQDAKLGIATGPFFLPLKAAVERLNPTLLILDTLADVYGADEIKREQVNWFLKTLLSGLIVSQRERGHALTVLLLGHPSLSGAQEGGRGYSGSGAWEAAVRSRLYLQRPEDGGPDERILTRGKANYASAGLETAMRLTWADGVFRAERELEESDPNLVGLKLRIERAVRNAWDLKLPYTVQRGHRRNVHVKLVRDLKEDGDDPSAIRQALRELLEAGVLVSGRNNKTGGLKVLE